MTRLTATTAGTTARVNGPEDDLDDWAAADWRAHEDNVRRLRQRIFKATQDGDLRRVRRLQKLIGSSMLTVSGPKPDRQPTSDQPPQHRPSRPRGLLEPSAVRVARSDLRGPRRSNAPRLPGAVSLPHVRRLVDVKRHRNGAQGETARGEAVRREGEPPEVLALRSRAIR